jgi:uncharacterized protein YhbP (UPF0306 family)
MGDTLATIETFIGKHHVMGLATSRDNTPQACSLFYAYMPSRTLFVVASDETTEHMCNALENPQVAATIVLETKTVGKIEGLQIKAEIRRADEEEGRAYFEAFPYAKVMNPTLWSIVPHHMKLTDNRLGFGKKLIWTRGVSE